VSGEKLSQIFEEARDIYELLKKVEAEFNLQYYLQELKNIIDDAGALLSEDKAHWTVKYSEVYGIKEYVVKGNRITYTIELDEDNLRFHDILAKLFEAKFDHIYNLMRELFSVLIVIIKAFEEYDLRKLISRVEEVLREAEKEKH